MDKVLKGGIIGAGKMGLAHSTILSCIQNVELTAIAEPNKLIQKTLKEFANHISIYDSHHKMLKNEKLDFVFITTPSYMHIPMALDCLEHNCNIFIEKPLCINSIDAIPLLEKIKQKKIHTMTGYMMRYISTFNKAKEIIKNGTLGDLITFNAQMYVSQLFKTGKGWRYDKKKSGGGVVITQTTHAIDLISWYFGYPNWLNASLLSPYSISTEDFGHITLKWNNGLMGWIDASWSVYNHRLLETSIMINGKNGNMKVNDDTIKIFLTKPIDEFNKGWNIIRKPEIETGVPIDIGGPQYTKQNVDFINCILKDITPESDIYNAYNIQKIVDYIYESNKLNGQLIKMD